MKIRKLRIENLRGLSNVQFDFDKSTNVIVGPNAIGKTTVLEAVRLAKALLMPRYFQEAQQVLVSLGVISPHPQLANYLDFGALARSLEEPVQVAMTFELAQEETSFIKTAQNQIALELLRARLGRNDDQGQLALTQFLSSEEGQTSLAAMTKEVEGRLEALQTPCTIAVQLTIDAQKRELVAQIASIKS